MALSKPGMSPFEHEQEVPMIVIHGGSVSPFVRKVHWLLAEKGVVFETRDLSPIPKTPELLALNPLGKIPILEDGPLVLPDSSVICAYLERKHPEPALYPEESVAYGRALWLEEYADTKLLEVTSPALFERVIKPRYFGQDADDERVGTVLAEQAPAVFDYLESQVEEDEPLVGGRFGIADVAVGAQLMNLTLAGESIDAARWPKLAAWSERTLARPAAKERLDLG